MRLYRMTSTSDVRTDHPVLKRCTFHQYSVTWCTDRTTHTRSRSVWKS